MTGVMRVGRTKPNSCRGELLKPASFQNEVTHWWDGSQIYGSDKATQDRVRAFFDGRLNVDYNGFIPIDRKTNIEITGNCFKVQASSLLAKHIASRGWGGGGGGGPKKKIL